MVTVMRPMLKAEPLTAQQGNGDSDETDVKSGAITAQQGGLESNCTCCYHGIALNLYKLILYRWLERWSIRI